MEIFQSGEFRLLTDRSDDAGGLNLEFTARLRHRARTPRRIRFAKLHADAAHSDRTSVSLQDFNRRGKELNMDALFQSAFDLRLDRRHLRTGAAIEQGNFSTQPLAYARGVDGSVTSADDDHLAADHRRFTAVHGIQELRAAEDIGSVFTGHFELDALLRADAHEHRLIILAELLQRHVLAHDATALQLNSQIQDALDLGIQHFARQPIRRNAVAQHAARLGESFENGYLVAPASQLVCARQSRGARAHHCDLLAARFIVQPGKFQLMGDAEVANEPLHRVDSDGAVLASSVARVLAGVRTDPPANRRKGIAFGQPLPEQFERLLVAAAVGLGLSDRDQQLANLIAVRTTAGTWRRLRHITGPQRADASAARPT